MSNIFKRSLVLTLFTLAVSLLPHADHALGFIPVALAADKPPIMIAHVAPTTGRFTLHAEADRRGTEMAIEEFNARGGVLGREIILVSSNPTLDSKVAAQVPSARKS
jgi:branched-chain amino acid transport system substrate-binding protein